MLEEKGTGWMILSCVAVSSTGTGESKYFLTDSFASITLLGRKIEKKRPGDNKLTSLQPVVGRRMTMARVRKPGGKIGMRDVYQAKPTNYQRSSTKVELSANESQ